MRVFIQNGYQGLVKPIETLNTSKKQSIDGMISQNSNTIDSTKHIAYT